MSISISIRKAEKTDQNAIWDIFHQVVKTGDTYTFAPNITKKEALDYWLGVDKYSYVAEYKGQIAGTFIIKDNQTGLGNHIANASFMVSPEFHGRSIGRQMGEYALLEAKRLGYEAMQFNIVISTNEPAVHLWQRLGFRIIGTIPEAFRHQGVGKKVDAYVMYRKL